MKNIIKGFGLALALVTSSVHAIPTLLFDGDINYTADGWLTVTSELTGAIDVAPTIPTLLGSSLNFSVFLNSVDATNTRVTVGYFGTGAGTDLSVIDGGVTSNTLLTGNFNTLSVTGSNGRSSGLVEGTLNADGGALQSLFGIGNLIALQFNLNTVFSADMFDSSFYGAIDGRLEGEAVNVPEPSIPALLALGILFIGFVNRTGLNRRSDV
ncbi:MAG: PEP-CTERM sorting domain-containing protein [Gammaproteobacteria bacterium]|nr:PEP-CTERM sorting domain-containing protein [Gammaproteobacteria bacterium]